MRKHIPNTITLMNLLCGSLGVIFTLKGQPQTAFLLMLGASVFDWCDGLAARLLGAYSDIGKELDSLCDMVSFGLLPALMLCCAMAASNPCTVLSYVPLFIALMSALRLAKFNIDERQHESFLGLPTPACAILCGALASFIDAAPESWLAGLASSYWFIPVLSLCLGLLLVSEIPMFSFKFGKGIHSDKATAITRIVFLSLSVLSIPAVLLAGLHWPLIPLLVFVLYILINIILAITRRNNSVA
ncbi:MAG: CDP-diacylglycerol--serine O-phosphatidyltransferase [Bacteroidales bacterium]|nr:CDP-diacylglycerol--serine O-phosphatidyltransferase [Bacteroidales bacterium]